VLRCDVKVTRQTCSRYLCHWWPAGEFCARCSASGVTQCSLMFRKQMLAFFLCAIVQGVTFARWRVTSEEQRGQGWKLYGFFTALSCLGCISGILAYAPRMCQLTTRYRADIIGKIPNRSLSEMQLFHELRAQQRRCTAAFYALFPVELAFVSVAYVLVLHRMQSFALLKSPHPARWKLAGRVFLSIVVILNLVGVCGNFAAAASYNRAADFSTLAATSYSVNDTKAGRAYALQAVGAGEVASVQRFCEVTLLIAIIAAFLVVGVNNIHTISSALRRLLTAELSLVSTGTSSFTGHPEVGRDVTIVAARSQGLQLLSRVSVTLVFVFLTFLVRSVFTIIYAMAQAFQDSFKTCASPDVPECDPCFGVYSNIQTFIIYEPAFQNMVIMLASPLTLLVARWGMAHGSARRNTNVQSEL
jgi:hypothetical protein